MEMICITRTYMTYGSVVAKGGSVLNFAAAMHMRIILHRFVNKQNTTQRHTFYSKLHYCAPATRRAIALQLQDEEGSYLQPNHHQQN